MNGSNDLMTDLGSNTYMAWAINDAGQVAGTPSNIFLWDSTNGLQDLGPCGLSTAHPTGINNSGEIVGYGTDSYFNWRAFHWTSSGGFSRLSELPNNNASKATGIDDAGQIVGTSGTAQHQIGGPSYLTIIVRAVAWQDGSVTSLGFSYDRNVAINNNGQITWMNYLRQNGSNLDLNNLIDPGQGWTINATTDINDAGQIVGQGTHNGVSQSYFLLTPNPSPSISFAVTGFPSPTTAGVTGSFMVTVTNTDGTPATGYTGTIHLSSSDPKAVLGADYTFTADDAGVHTFSATLKTAGWQKITAWDPMAASVAFRASTSSPRH